MICPINQEKGEKVFSYANLEQPPFSIDMPFVCWAFSVVISVLLGFDKSSQFLQTNHDCEFDFRRLIAILSLGFHFDIH